MPPGSSPLARGLPGGRLRRRDRKGIIPARAGFTGVLVGIPPRLGDHPRSRGVYWARRGRPYARPGSSPLARGLRTRPTTGGAWRRIIPARAGFTSPGGRGRGPRRDHPRSRGVYVEQLDASKVDAGSSPLARGLHRPETLLPDIDRIIPARAGFTRPRRQPVPPRRDHPRSRGVYPAVVPDPPPAIGSSPLARGLPRSRSPPSAPLRIIPARAGFTRTPFMSVCGTTDHPRSRGVYPWTSPSGPPSCGSSPLARGLQTSGDLSQLRWRIIPARAGFTFCRPPLRLATQDHPRSRGVYPADDRGAVAEFGSSPLARGLLQAFLDINNGNGIIPARAGFTQDLFRGGVHAQDHPRSRGVYRCRAARPCVRRGSSPLARGLRPVRDRGPGPPRIIPARAGFTWRGRG